MKKNLLLVLFIFSFVQLLFTQNQELSLKDAVIGNNRHMYPERLQQLQWRAEKYNFTYVENDQIIEESSLNSKKNTVIGLEKLDKIIQKNGYSELKKIPAFKWYNKNSIQFTQDTTLIVFDIKSKKAVFDIKYPQNAENIDFCKKNSSIAYTIKNNLFIITTDEEISKLTIDEDENIVNGGNYVHRAEFGISKGTFWSPEGNFLAYYKQDLSTVSNYPLVNITTRIAEVENIKYPMAGMKSEEVIICIYNNTDKTTISLQTGEPAEQYLTNISWGANEKYIYVQLLNRGQDHLKLNQYEVSTGKLVKTLFEKTDEKYVEPEEALKFNPVNSDQFIYFSEEDGFYHMYLYNTNGELIKQLTKGNWVVTSFYGYSNDGNYIFYQSNERNPIERDIYKLLLETGKKQLLSKKNGTHSANFNADKSLFIDQFSSLEIPRDYFLTKNNGENIRTVFSAKNPLQDYNIGEMSIFTIKAGDNETDLYARMIKPVNFDSTKKYPVIIYVYGGPHSQLVSNTWMGKSRLWQYYMAQKGYLVLTIDNRGTAYRGFEFESTIHRQLGKLEIEDQIKGIDFLFNLDYVDTSRIGIHGWSYGGFMTISLMQNYPGIFKVGVAGGPVTDWKFYEVMYGERYMDTPQENPEGYETTKLNDKVENLKGKLLIVHGGIDGTVVWQHSLTYINECIKKGIPVDYFVYPRHEHNVRGKDRLHLMDKVSMYFDDYL